MGEIMVAKHAVWPRVDDPIFNISERAQKAIKTLGKENVINATIGALTDDDGNLITLNTVFDEYKSLPNSEIAAYASIAGHHLKHFTIQTNINFLFKMKTNTIRL